MLFIQRFHSYLGSAILCMIIVGCAGDPLQSGLDPFAPRVFKEDSTVMPLNPPNKSTLQPFYVSQTTVFKFAIDLDSILIGADGVTRYTVIIINPSGGQQAQYEGIRCDSYQTRIYGNYDNTGWKENPLSSWKAIQSATPNRYQAALAQGALCNIDIQEKNIDNILKSLNPKGFTGQNKPSNSMGVIIGY